MALSTIIKNLADKDKCEEDVIQLCGQLRWLALREDNRPVVEGAGTVGSMVDVMNRYPKESEVQLIAMEVLCNLAATKEIASKMVHREPLVLECVSEAFKAFHKHGGVQLQACTLVHLLSAAQGTSASLVEHNVVGYVLAAMQNVNTVKIVTECCATLGNMAKDDEELVVAFSQDGCVLEFILKAFRQNYSSSELVLAACGALAQFACNEVTHKQIIEGEALDYFLLALETHQYNPDVTVGVCGAMRPILHLCKEDHSDVVIVLLRMLKRHGEHEDPQLFLGVFGCMADILEECTDVGCDPKTNIKAKVVKLQAHMLATDVQERFSDNEELISCVARFLGSLAINKWSG